MPKSYSEDTPHVCNHCHCISRCFTEPFGCNGGSKVEKVQILNLNFLDFQSAIAADRVGETPPNQEADLTDTSRLVRSPLWRSGGTQQAEAHLASNRSLSFASDRFDAKRVLTSSVLQSCPNVIPQTHLTYETTAAGFRGVSPSRSAVMADRKSK